MKAKFNENFGEWLASKNYKIIPTKEVYGKILTVLQDKNNGLKRKWDKTERNWLTRFVKLYFLQSKN